VFGFRRNIKSGIMKKMYFASFVSVSLIFCNPPINHVLLISRKNLLIPAFAGHSGAFGNHGHLKNI